MENFLGGDGVDVLEMRSGASRCPARGAWLRGRDVNSLFARGGRADSPNGIPSPPFPPFKALSQGRQNPTLPLGFLFDLV